MTICRRVVVIVAAILAILGGASAAQAQPTAQPGQLFKWDHPTAEGPTIARFEVKIDAGSYVNAGKTAASDAATPAGFTSYSFVIPALTPGNHSYVVRACPTSGSCTADSASFAFGIIVVSVPTGLRISPAPLEDDEDEDN